MRNAILILLAPAAIVTIYILAKLLTIAVVEVGSLASSGFESLNGFLFRLEGGTRYRIDLKKARARLQKILEYILWVANPHENEELNRSLIAESTKKTREISAAIKVLSRTIGACCEGHVFIGPTLGYQEMDEVISHPLALELQQQTL